jgi:hypothetical protein
MNSIWNSIQNLNWNKLFLIISDCKPHETQD